MTVEDGSTEEVSTGEAPIDEVTTPADGLGGRSSAPASDSDLGVLLAALLGGAGIVHLVAASQHVGGGSWVDPVGFALVGWLQLAPAAVLLARRASRGVVALSLVVNAVALTLWTLSRTVGLPVGSHVGVVEPVGLADGITVALQVLAVVVAVVILTAGERVRVGRVLPATLGVAALALATLPLVTGEATTVHEHAAHNSEMAAVDAARCDMGFNPQSYWDVARRTGVDTYAGGAMASHSAVASSADGHGHGTTATSLLDSLRANPDPLEGRGSAGLDDLVSATNLAAGGEVASARLVEALSRAEDEDYSAWERWTAARAGAGGGHAHGAAAPAAGSAAAGTGDDNGGHGGHAGAQPWTAMVDQAQCVKLAKELATARAVAAKYPTAAAAEAGGWQKVTPYVPGIAAHYMKFSIVDGEFDVEQPEMLLYDGEGPDSHIVGLSYYMLHDGTDEPTQGFTGPNDHFHRHVGLCTSNESGVVIGDSTTTVAECEARGGRKADGSSGWMAHAWVVPGCESPWGVFSGANPLLDSAVTESAPTNDGHCAGNRGGERYDLRPGERPAATSGGETASGN